MILGQDRQDLHDLLESAQRCWYPTSACRAKLERSLDIGLLTSAPLCPLIWGLNIVLQTSTNVPIMDTKSRVDGLDAALFGKSRRAVLGLLYGHPDQAFYLRQIARITGTGIGALQRELKLLTDAGILLREKVGNQVHFQANNKCPVFAELKSLIVKMTGVADILKAALSSLSDRIWVAFLFGSMASANGNADSDVDVMIVGDVSFKEAVEALAPAQEPLGREVNPVVYGPDEFEKKRKEGHHFTLSVLENEKIFLIGSEDDLSGRSETSGDTNGRVS